jgi:lipopolysaccharide heptosyltransferase II
MRILAIRLGAVGDVLNVLPAIRGLKEAMPEARVSWVVEEAAAPLLLVSPDIEKTFAMPRRRWEAALPEPDRAFGLPGQVSRFIRGLAEEDFEVILDFQGSLKSGLLGFMSGVRRRIGFAAPHCREFNHLFTTEQVSLPERAISRAEKGLALVRALAPNASLARPALVCPPGDVEFAKGVVANLRSDAEKLVGIHPGTSKFGRLKRWPVERYGEVARRLAREFRARTIVTWGPGEASLAQQVVDLSDGAAVMCPATTLTQLCEIIRHLDVFISSDTGPLHLAAILGKPVVAIFGPKDPVVYAPYCCAGVIVRKDLPCSPCAKHRCLHPRCILEITSRDVFEAAARMLAVGGIDPGGAG